MISSTLGAPLGGTMRGGHHGFDCLASSLITPPNLGSGTGSCFPEIVVVAPGEPGVPVVSISALAIGIKARNADASSPGNSRFCLVLMLDYGVWSVISGSKLIFIELV